MEGADISTFGEALALFRTRAGLSQQKLADRLGKSRRSVAAWEAGDYLPKAKGDVLELARIFVLNDEEATILLKVSGMDPSPSLWNVPHQRNPYFTGRDNLFDQLDQYLAPPEHIVSAKIRRVALTQPHAIKGLGGIGKTQLAVEYAYRSRELGRYTHTFWVNAASEETIIASFVAIAEVLPSYFAKNETDQRKLIEAVKRWLEQCERLWLLIFGNADADDLSFVQSYFPKRGLGSILLTTRANAVGSIAASIEVEKMGFMEGSCFLLRRACGLANFSPEEMFEHVSDEKVNEAGNIVVALDHFPLALDQAGAYIEETRCSLSHYLELSRTHSKALRALRGNQSTNYPESVATTWEISFQKVKQGTPAATELLHLCAFSKGKMTKQSRSTNAPCARSHSSREASTPQHRKSERSTRASCAPEDAMQRQQRSKRAANSLYEKHQHARSDSPLIKRFLLLLNRSGEDGSLPSECCPTGCGAVKRIGAAPFDPLHHTKDFLVRKHSLREYPGGTHTSPFSWFSWAWTCSS